MINLASFLSYFKGQYIQSNYHLCRVLTKNKIFCTWIQQLSHRSSEGCASTRSFGVCVRAHYHP